MAADERTTWGEVCERVNFRDGLYSVCRKKVPGFTGLGAFDAVPDVEDEPEFSTQLARSALPVPPPPPDDWEEEPEGILENILNGDTGRYLLYGGAAAAVVLVWWFYLRTKPQQIAVTETPAAPARAPLSDVDAALLSAAAAA